MFQVGDLVISTWDNNNLAVVVDIIDDNLCPRVLLVMWNSGTLSTIYEDEVRSKNGCSNSRSTISRNF